MMRVKRSSRGKVDFKMLLPTHTFYTGLTVYTVFIVSPYPPQRTRADKMPFFPIAVGLLVLSIVFLGCSSKPTPFWAGPSGAIGDGEQCNAVQRQEQNMPPYRPHTPHPADNAVEQGSSLILSWQGGDPNPEDTVTYSLLYGTEPGHLPGKITAINGTSYPVKNLMAHQNYYWQVIATDNNGVSNSSEVWRLKTQGRLPKIQWEKSLPVGETVMGDDNGVDYIGGTEIRDVVTFDGKLFAANGYWTDKYLTNQAFKHEVPGAQVFRLDGPNAQWVQDGVLADRIDFVDDQGYDRQIIRYLAVSVLKPVTIEYGLDGQPLDEPKSFLLGGVWDFYDGMEVFYRTAGPNGVWNKSVVVPSSPVQNFEDPCNWAESRSFAIHRDNNVDRLFVGTKGKGPNCPTRIFSGGYDPETDTIVWDQNAEAFDVPPALFDRVMSMTVANDRLYATVCGKVYERQNKLGSAQWTLKYRHHMDHCPEGPGEWGFRGATTIQRKENFGEELLLVTEGNVSQVSRLDPWDNFRNTTELDLEIFVEKQWWRPGISYLIAGYNRMLSVNWPSVDDEEIILMGIEANTKAPGSWHNWEPGGWLVARFTDGPKEHFELHEIVDPSIVPKPTLVAPRAITVSPFAEDEGKVLYAGGFDANHVEKTNHNTAWLYRGELVVD